MNLEETCLRNLGAWLSQTVDSYHFCDHDVEYIIELNKTVAHKLSELLGDRVQGVSSPSFLCEIDGEPEAALIECHKLVSAEPENHRVADIAVQLVQPCIDDSSLTLFMHSIALPGNWDDHHIDRCNWRSRRAYKTGSLYHVELPAKIPVQMQKPPGHGLTFEQIAEGTIYQEDG